MHATVDSARRRLLCRERCLSDRHLRREGVGRKQRLLELALSRYGITRLMFADRGCTTPYRTQHMLMDANLDACFALLNLEEMPILYAS